ncbi:MAG: hypothetical protein B6242_04485 [Anaerolineaceae bacterium 4572_78]|nr:MAG: hypothetical protein B6242_04485 [Anaerolineaceae bacterium 4572_78]
MLSATSVKISNRYQIAIPSLVRKQLNIHAGERLLIDIHGNMIILLPQPQNFVQYLSGLHQDVWQGINTTQYLDKEREAWTY